MQTTIQEAMSFSFNTQVPGTPPTSTYQDDNLSRVFSSLFTSGKHSDLLIKCHGQSWKAHRAVVCVQSRPLAAACDGNFREAVTGEIDLEDDDPEIVKLMLEFLYTGKISVETPKLTTTNDSNSAPAISSRSLFTQPTFGSSTNPNPFDRFNSPTLATQGSVSGAQPVRSAYPTNSTGSSRPISAAVAELAKGLVTSSAVYVIAEKYDIQPLKDLARRKYDSLLPSAWNSQSFIESLRLIYDGTPETSKPDGLRLTAIRTAAYHAKELLDRGEFVSLCRERGDIATDILRASLDVGSQRRCKVDPSHVLHLEPSFQVAFGSVGPKYKCARCGTFVD